MYVKDETSAVALAVDDTYHEAMMRWNAAMYAALIATPSALSDLLFAIDQEIDRLSDEAKGQQLSTPEFRAERRHLGQLVAQYVDAARRTSGLPVLGLPSAWSWDAEPSVGSSASAGGVGTSGAGQVGP